MREIMFSLCLTLAIPEVADKENLRFIHSSEQGFDTSCGLSVLSCLLGTYWDSPADELELIEELGRTSPSPASYAVSFADLTRLARDRGFTTAAYKMDFPQLMKAAGRYAPILVHYDRPEGHYALVLDADEERVVVADPASGTSALDRGVFLSRWFGYVLLAARAGREPRRDRIAEAVRLARGRLTRADSASRALIAGASR